MRKTVFCLTLFLKGIELLKNSMIQINKIASNVHFNTAETDRELIFQQLLMYLESVPKLSSVGATLPRNRHQSSECGSSYRL
ncbi:hypothetical protein LBK6_10630 [Leptospira borgpetersenii serovar Hardjo]|nr:hypothetical protein LBK6_10630 [Leptospira borgpetersenii serovar Hardjo]AWV70573.1 hypothetical protein B9T54_11500 [Leptospira borgpetersenii serovar Hardjo-bovis]AMX62025.1 hypothetical protein LBK9_10670 [Leptospira borgpetersenii serovar Hardjo]AMX65268.1 hypothetical protein LBK30_10690 [Leptospira borgpetersenii serovar Hardjo]AMX68478.1 hypothetical protein LBHA_10525 [Leptospira borgpetersenii serovar Hardjo]